MGGKGWKLSLKASETEDSTEKVKPVDIRLGGCLLLRRPGALTPTGADRPRELVSHLQRALSSPPPSRRRGRYKELQGSVPLLFPPGGKQNSRKPEQQHSNNQE